MKRKSDHDKNEKIIIHIEPDIEELVPRFLDNKHEDIKSISKALDVGDFETIRILGTSMKGSGAGFGFDRITDLGGKITIAASDCDGNKIRELIEKLSFYLDKVEVVPSSERAGPLSMNLLIVDDSEDSRLLIHTILKKAGYTNLYMAESAHEAFIYLGMGSPDYTSVPVDVILMDIVMPEMEGITALKKIKMEPELTDVPVIMITALSDDFNLQTAFEHGAIDYITKPINKVRLLGRIRSVLKLKMEMDRRKKLMKQLLESNRALKRLTLIDGLTGIANRRHFDQTMESEWRRMRRDKKPISLLMLDIDYFKKYNDQYGHQNGDDCLKSVAKAIAREAKRAGDLAARYGGEEFAVLLPDTSSSQAMEVSEKIIRRIESMRIVHEKSSVSDFITLSIGVAGLDALSRNMSPQYLIESADQALYKAKDTGRNRVVFSEA